MTEAEYTQELDRLRLAAWSNELQQGLKLCWRIITDQQRRIAELESMNIDNRLQCMETWVDEYEGCPAQDADEPDDRVGGFASVMEEAHGPAWKECLRTPVHDPNRGKL